MTWLLTIRSQIRTANFWSCQIFCQWIKTFLLQLVPYLCLKRTRINHSGSLPAPFTQKECDLDIVTIILYLGREKVLLVVVNLNSLMSSWGLAYQNCWYGMGNCYWNTDWQVFFLEFLIEARVGPKNSDF